ncbi:type III secretion protein [Trinickia sp.]|uniref:type III secretion protein n=1 Tax=Trinickia sp. TaxID=2571163 RepID=UPI003F8025A7
MYEPFEACATDFKNLKGTLADPAGSVRLAAIREALEASARNISAVAGETEVDRDNLAKLYRGLLAAGRIVSHLQEKRAAP